jgi:hypothetical protein
MLQYSRKLSVFQKRTELVQECLDELLANGSFSSFLLPSLPMLFCPASFIPAPAILPPNTSEPSTDSLLIV